MLLYFVAPVLYRLTLFGSTGTKLISYFKTNADALRQFESILFLFLGESVEYK